MAVGDEAEVEHAELVAELAKLEKLSADERLKAARKRRLSQLSRFKVTLDTEKLFPPIQKANKGRPIRFEESVTLIEASARNDAEEVAKFLKNGMNPDLQNQDGLSALHQAVIEDCDDVVHVLIEGGADMNIKDADLWTPLHAAVACGNFDLVKYLNEKGADLVAINADGNMPIDLVDENEDIEMYLDNQMTEKGFTEDQLDSIRNAVADEMMLDLRDSVQKGRELDVPDDNGATAMHIAAANGYLEVIEFLLENGAKIDTKDKDGWQPIHAASCWGQDTAIEILFDHGADLDARTNDNETPFDLTEDDELIEIMTELRDSGRKIPKSVKRSQSNSSRSLCVRRLSLVDKHQTSKNDAMNEGMFFQKPEVMNVMINADDAEEDEEQKRESLKRPSKDTKENDKPKEKLIPAPLRPPSLNRHSGDHSDTPQQSTPAVIKVTSDEKTQHNDTKPPVDQAAVTITIGDNKKKEETGSEPHLVAYKKVASPAPATAPMADPEVDSPVKKRPMEAEQPRNTAAINDEKTQNDTENKHTSDDARNGKITVKDGTTVHKKCCVIL